MAKDYVLREQPISRTAYERIHAQARKWGFVATKLYSIPGGRKHHVVVYEDKSWRKGNLAQFRLDLRKQGYTAKDITKQAGSGNNRTLEVRKMYKVPKASYARY